jgi:hypothetical protein
MVVTDSACDHAGLRYAYCRSHDGSILHLDVPSSELSVHLISVIRALAAMFGAASQNWHSVLIAEVVDEGSPVRFLYRLLVVHAGRLI